MPDEHRPSVDPFAPDDDNPLWTPEDFASARPGREVFAELGMEPPRPRGRPKSERPKQQVTLRLDADVVDHFRAQGDRWQTAINRTLREAAFKSVADTAVPKVIGKAARTGMYAAAKGKSLKTTVVKQDAKGGTFTSVKTGKSAKGELKVRGTDGKIRSGTKGGHRRLTGPAKGRKS